MRQPTRILVVGCGGIGGWIAADLSARGFDVLPVTRNPEIAAAINRDGFVLHDKSGVRRVAGRAVAEIPTACGHFDFALLATQPPQVVEAAQAALPVLAPEGALVCLQNGLCEQRIAPLVGPEKTLGAIVSWGGSMLRPGVYERTSAGGFVIGRLDGADDPRFPALAEALSGIGPVDVTHNLEGARWSKLAINCAISSLGTIGGERLGELIRYRFVRRLALEIMTEAVITARQLGIRLEKVAGTIDLDWTTLSAEDTRSGSPSLAAKHALLLAVGAKFRRLRSSMLAAIERGREPAIDFLNGEVVRHAARAHVAVPINHRVAKTVTAIWRGDSKPSLDLLRRLYDDSRADAYAAAVAAYRSDTAQPTAH